MKRSRSDVPTGASLFRELKLKRQRLSMLLNRDINDVLSSTSSSDTGDHGSDGDAGPPLMLREDSACFESRRHDAVDSGASSDGDWSFCGYTNRHPPMLIPIIDQTQLLPGRAAQPSALFSGHILSNDQQMFTSGKPGLEAESDSNITSASAQGIDFCHTNVTAASSTVTSSCIIADVSQSRMASDTSSHAEMERNSGTKSKLSSGIWQLRDTFRKGHSCNAEKYNHQPNGITSGLAFPQHLVKDGTEMGSFPSADNNSVVPVSLMPPATDSDPVSDPSTKDCYSATVGQMDVNASMTMSSQSCPSSGDDQSCRQTTVSFTTDHVHCERTCLEERSVIRCGSDLVIGIKLEDTLRANPVPAAVALANGDKPVLDWRRLEKLKQTQETCYSPLKQDKAEPSKEQLVCEICTDRASGLHYGIISCEGCKGFFKRTVQNKRVYSCIAEGDCQVTKLRRNRCQYCRFKKCLLKGMVLAAVRDDRMPGGRNSGAVYSLYKVKYRKPGRTADNGVRRAIAPRRLRSVHGVTSKSAQSRAGTSSHCDATARPLWQISHSIQDVDTASHCDTSLQALPQCAALCSQVIDGGIHNRNVSAESLSVSEDTTMSTGNHSASHNRQINADSATVSHYPNADSPTVSRYLKADSPTVSRYLSAESPTVSRYLSADSPTVSHHLSADSPTVSRYVSADSPTVSHVRYSDNVDMNHTRRTVIADSRKMTEDRSQTSYDRVNMNALYGNINYNNENMDSHHMNQSIHKMSFSVDSETKSSDMVDHLVHVDELLQCEHAHDLAAATQPYSGASLTTLLQHLSDNVVRELVKWMKTLPFYNQLPISVHRHCLAEKWYDLLLLTMLAHQACTGHAQDSTTDDVNSHVARNVRRLQRGLRHVLEHELPIDELYREVGDIVQKLTDIVLNFRKLGLTREEYVCLKVILLLNRECMADANQTAEHIQDVYRSVLQQLVTDTFPHQPTRLSELLLQLPHIQTASALLMKTNTIYIPSMLNAPLHQQ